MLQDHIEELKRIYADKEEGYPAAFEDVLGRIAQLNDANSIQLLLPLFEDAAEYDELMFSIVHTIEIFDDSVYVPQVLDGFVALNGTSPRWATILLMRVLNSPTTLDELKGLLPSVSTPQRDAVLTVATRISDKRSEFKARVDELRSIVS